MGVIFNSPEDTSDSRCLLGRLYKKWAFLVRMLSRKDAGSEVSCKCFGIMKSRLASASISEAAHECGTLGPDFDLFGVSSVPLSACQPCIAAVAVPARSIARIYFLLVIRTII